MGVLEKILSIVASLIGIAGAAFKAYKYWTNKRRQETPSKTPPAREGSALLPIIEDEAEPICEPLSARGRPRVPAIVMSLLVLPFAALMMCGGVMNMYSKKEVPEFGR